MKTVKMVIILLQMNNQNMFGKQKLPQITDRRIDPPPPEMSVTFLCFNEKTDLLSLTFETTACG